MATPPTPSATTEPTPSYTEATKAINDDVARLHSLIVQSDQKANVILVVIGFIAGGIISSKIGDAQLNAGEIASYVGLLGALLCSMLAVFPRAKWRTAHSAKKVQDVYVLLAADPQKMFEARCELLHDLMRIQDAKNKHLRVGFILLLVALTALIISISA